VAAPPARFSRKGEAASAVEELEEAARLDMLTAPFRTAPTARVERRHDLANILSDDMPQLEIDSQQGQLLN